MRFLFLFLAMCVGCQAFAQENGDVSFFTQVIDYVEAFGGLSWVLKIAGGITLILSTMKVSFLKPIWDKLGDAQAWAAPVLGLISGLLMTAVDGNFTWAAVSAYVFSGAGAIILHELLDTIKSIPKLGTGWVTVIEVIKSLLGSPKKETPV